MPPEVGHEAELVGILGRARRVSDAEVAILFVGEIVTEARSLVGLVAGDEIVGRFEALAQIVVDMLRGRSQIPFCIFYIHCNTLRIQMSPIIKI